MAAKVAPYGSWESPIKAEAIASATLKLGWTRYDGADLYWLEGRPAEGGRIVLVKRAADGKIEDVTPQGFNTRTLVHEYGGGAYVVADGVAYFSNLADQNLYCVRSKDDKPKVLTTAGDTMRYADMSVDKKRNRIICVREDHSFVKTVGEAQASIVAIPLDGEPSAGVQLVVGANFYSTPRVSPDGSKLMWLTWNHPNMPWDGTWLQIAQFEDHKRGLVGNIETIAGSESESLFQPEWGADGSVYFISDKSGWWNPYVFAAAQIEETLASSGSAKHQPRHLVNMPNEFGTPQWVFGMSTYAFDEPDSLLCTYCVNGNWQLARVNVHSGDLKNIDVSFTEFSYVVANAGRLAACAASPTEQNAVVEIDTKSGAHTVVRTSNPYKPDAKYISVPEPIEFPSENGRKAYAFFYKPKNDDFQAPSGELPPLLVKCHGGPTGATSSTLSLGIQYWTSRGFAVVDVNYGGSSGYGRPYRDLLERSWGLVDKEDCENAARYLAKNGFVDPRRTAITGGSAGGYTVLCALTFGNVFQAGASHFGVSNVETLVADTHKFESRYGDKLHGPYPECKQDYFDRSPINFADQLDCPVIFFQGLEDKVVPPSQAEAMVNALRRKKVPVAYLAYEGEQHGFRKAENIKRTLDSEFYFYSRIFKFEPADKIDPVEIENLEPIHAK
jgi:dipeptidyl aminopeptidase/acylaminoacyl peptidase